MKKMILGILTFATMGAKAGTLTVDAHKSILALVKNKMAKECSNLRVGNITLWNEGGDLSEPLTIRHFELYDEKAQSEAEYKYILQPYLNFSVAMVVNEVEGAPSTHGITVTLNEKGKVSDVSYGKTSDEKGVSLCK